MKRSPLQRRTALARRSRLPARRATARRSERQHDSLYMDRVRRLLPCSAGDMLGDEARCEGRIEADHAGRKVAGRKADDQTCIAMCSRHHRERHDFSGVFRGWSGDEMRAWLDAQIGWTQKRLHVFAAGEAGTEASL